MQGKSSSILLLALFFCAGAIGTQQLLHFEASGFSIAPLGGGDESTASQPVMMFLPVSENFAANVGVQIQPFDGSLEDYVALSIAEFKSLDMTILEESASTNSHAWKYEGEFQGRNLRFYSKAVVGDNKVYLVTATALQSQWEQQGDELTSCVDSFTIDQDQ